MRPPITLQLDEETIATARKKAVEAGCPIADYLDNLVTREVGASNVPATGY